ncbi:MAG: putative 2OG-Fe(II) oxygenase, partial [Reyranella sp.]|nr:putative 2OG-Fe(II) oxygenase [Reyranella sp.]
MIEKQEVQEIFPTPLWVVDLKPAAAAALNTGLKAEIERLIAPRPAIPAGSNWQTPQDLHTRPAFAEFVKLVETAARGVARFLQVDQYPMGITGCWANVNPPGAYHPMHHHPNNYLSGVYYVA